MRASATAFALRATVDDRFAFAFVFDTTAARKMRALDVELGLRPEAADFAAGFPFFELTLAGFEEDLDAFLVIFLRAAMAQLSIREMLTSEPTPPYNKGWPGRAPKSTPTRKHALPARRAE
jgi:hypothetical protein